MWFVAYALLVGIVNAEISSPETLPQVSRTFDEVTGQCLYTFSVPCGQCSNSSDQEVPSGSADATEKQLRQELRQLQSTVLEQNNELAQLKYRMQLLEDTLKEHGLEHKKFQDCAEYRLTGRNTSDVYNISLEHALSPISVWCDMDTEKGGWTLFQRRQDGSVYFLRNWDEYKQGFGNINGEYWLGNDNIYRLTNQKKYLLRVDMWDFDGNYLWAEYDNFMIENELHKYKLHVGSYRGTAGDGLSYHNNMLFSTTDRDNDKSSASCAYTTKGAFWYNSCYHTNPNGMYHAKKYRGDDSISWNWPVNRAQALRKIEFKVRPMTFHRK